MDRRSWLKSCLTFLGVPFLPTKLPIEETHIINWDLLTPPLKSHCHCYACKSETIFVHSIFVNDGFRLKTIFVGGHKFKLVRDVNSYCTCWREFLSIRVIQGGEKVVTLGYREDELCQH